MKSLAALVALLGLFACGQAADAPASPMDGDDGQPGSDTATSADLSNQPASTRADRAPRTVPEAAPEWRTCETDDDCERRESVCMPLAARSSETYCRRALVELGGACEGDRACELGLFCRWTKEAGEPVCQLNEYPGVLNGPNGEHGPRKPLACEPDGSSVDARCELVD